MAKRHKAKYLAAKNTKAKMFAKKRAQATKFAKKAKENVFVQARENIGDSLRGLTVACTNKTFRWLILPSVVVMGVVGTLLGFKLGEWLILALLLLLVVVTEIINSSIEEANDVACDGALDERVRNSKDMSSAAVFVCVLAVAVAFGFFVVCHLSGWQWWEYLF